MTEEITYRLSDETGDGSLTHTGSYKITLSLEGLMLTSQTGAAMTIKNGKRIAVVMKDGTENVLTDKEGGDIHIEAFDDCINAAGDIRISGGDMYPNSFDWVMASTPTRACTSVAAWHCHAR